MTPWRWWWKEEHADDWGGWEGDCDSREAAVREAQRLLPSGTAFLIVEARSSTSLEYEGAECVPFLRTRNKERLGNGPAAIRGEDR